MPAAGSSSHSPAFLLAFLLNLLGSALSLLLPYARLGSGSSEDLTWTLSDKCPLCETAANFFSPMAALVTATNVAFYMVTVAILLDLVAGLLISFLDSNPDAAGFVLCLASGCLFLAPFCFFMLLPGPPQVMLNNQQVQFKGGPTLSVAFGAWLGGICALSALVLVGFTIKKNKQHFVLPMGVLRERTRTPSGPVATYGALV